MESSASERIARAIRAALLPGRRTFDVCLASLVVVAAFACMGSVARAGPMFQGLGDVSGGIFDSVAQGLSGDGTMVVGVGNSASGEEAFYWTAGGGLTGLGDLPGGTFGSRAFATTADGSVIVGVGDRVGGSTSQAFRWTASGGMVGLGDLDGGIIGSGAMDITPDGSVIAGYGSTAEGREAVSWNALGEITGLGQMDGSTDSRARGVSADGLTIVGDSIGIESGNFEAWRWGEAEGFTNLGALPGGEGRSQRAFDVSADGSVVVGYGYDESYLRAFRWTEENGMESLGDFPGGVQSLARAITPDGSVIVGAGTVPGDPYAISAAAIWDDAHGMRSIQDILVDLGIDMSGWTLLEATAVTPDGQTICGVGFNPYSKYEAWVATIPEPASLCLLGLGALVCLNRRR